jgi:holo-[acyl-carrier protein] synthase
MDLCAIARLQRALPYGLRLALGVDTVDVDSIRSSLTLFGSRFENRLFTSGELSDARAVNGGYAERLAARFAAKEAAIKAFDLAHVGVDWRQIEVKRACDGRPSLYLHGKVARLLSAMGAFGVEVSLSHDGAQACAVVAALLSPPQSSYEPNL